MRDAGCGMRDRKLPIADCRLPIDFPPRHWSAQLSPVMVTRIPFSKAFGRRAGFVPELPASALVSLENSAAQKFPAHQFGGARLLTSRATLRLNFVFRAAREDAHPTVWIQAARNERR